MSKDKVWKMAVLIAIPIIIWMFPPPQGLSPLAWKLFGLYFSTIVGLVIRPFPEPVLLLGAMAASAVTIGWGGDKAVKIGDVLSAYSSGTVWLVFGAFTMSAAFGVTGLGKRIAYILIGKLGSTTLGLGYVTALLDLVIAPATPSNTARAGGIVFPIINSVAMALGSTPETPRKAGSYLMVNTYMVTKITSFMFLTAMAPNVLALSMMSDIMSIKLTWNGWAIAAAVPGIIMLALVPWVIYKMNPPEIKHVDNKSIASKGLDELGSMTTKEKIFFVIFIMALLGWIFAAQLKINEATVVIIAMALCLFTGVVSWDDILKNKGGWTTFIWFGGIIGMSGILTKAGFFKWLAEFLKTHMNFGDNGTVALIVILLISVAVRYLFASGSAYVAAMIPVFATVGMVAGAPPLPMALALLFSNAYGGALTHYGGAAAPIIFGAGYNTIKEWWIVGGVIAVLCLLVHSTIGLAWWNFLMGRGII